MINETQIKRYCSEDISKIENYEQAVADTTQTWHCHHRLEVQGQFRNSLALLKKCGMYYNVPASQLIFLTKSEHRRLHGIGRNLSEETKKKLSLSHRGKSPWNKSKSLSEETRKKMSLSHRGKHLSEETKKKLSIANSGEKHPMFGKHETHPMFGKHHSAESRKKMSNALRKLSWWNNGSITKRSKECPGRGWVRGRKPH